MVDKSYRTLTKHSNAHTGIEIKWIKNYTKRNPHITLCELWYKLWNNKSYARCIESLYRVLKRIGFYNKINIKNIFLNIMKHQHIKAKNGK